MEYSSFFNSINHDRRYKAERFARYFAHLVGNGVSTYPAMGLQVVPGEGLSVVMKAGEAWIKGYQYVNDSDKIFTFSPADGQLNRIERIVVHWSLTARDIWSDNKTSAPATVPIAPGYQRDADIYELVTYDVEIIAGATSISQANIKDHRADTSFCGLVVGIGQKIDTTQLFAQFESKFEEWFAGVRGTLSGDAAGNLFTMIGEVRQTALNAQSAAAAAQATATAAQAAADAAMPQTGGAFTGMVSADSTNRVGYILRNNCVFEKDGTTQRQCFATYDVEQV